LGGLMLMLALVWPGAGYAQTRVWPGAGYAQTRVADQVYHTAWTAKDGVPHGISDMAQTTDGYLWLAAETGLFRFDGVRFEKFTPADGAELPGAGTFDLKALPDGSLWIAWRLHGVSRLKDGVLKTYDREDGLPSSTIFAVEQDGAGRIWAASQIGLYLFDGSRWHKVGAEMNFVHEHFGNLFVDSLGSLWTTDYSSPIVLRKGSTRFETMGAGLEVVSFAEDQSHAVWGFDQKGAFTRLTGPGTPGRIYRLSDEPVRSSEGRFDHSGGLWVENSGNGLYRIPDFAGLPDRDGTVPAEIYSTKSGDLSADGSHVLLEDREGNMWVATTKGLDRYRRKLFTSAKLPTAFVNIALLPAHNGSILAGAMNQPLFLFPGPIPDVKSTLGPKFIASVYRDPDGVSWIGGRDSFWRFDQSGFTKIERPHQDFDVQAITTDGHGGLWVAIGPRYSYHYTNGQWLEYGNNPNVPKLCPFSEMTDSQGRVWFGYQRNQIGILSQAGGMKFITSKEGLNLGAVSAFHEHGDAIWVGGEKGLLRFTKDHFEPVLADGDRSFHGVTGIIQRRNGDLWINEAEDIALIPLEELQRAHASPGYKVHARFFDSLDGLEGGAPQLRPIPTEIETDDGRLWFSLANDAVWLDPEKIFHNAVLPVVDIQAVDADGKLYRQLKNLTLNVNPSSVRIDFTAASLTVPERVLFRYKLDGVDRDWQEAGTRRQAFYTQLRPGSYHFHVLACNNDGLWNDTGASLSFVIPPTFGQTIWFKLLLVALTAGCLALIVAWRFRISTERVRSQLSERLVERERIARELHDTLLQGFQGLLLKFQTATNKIPVGEPAKVMMESALATADEILLEGRDKVLDLRSNGPDSGNLADAFAALAEDHHFDPGPAVHVEVSGTNRELHPVVRDELYAIGKEAILNALRHANATVLRCEIAFDDSHVALLIRDNGRGIDSHSLQHGREGHWGLSSMRERAAKIGAVFMITSQSDQGTVVEVRIPAVIAYRKSSGKPSWWTLLIDRLRLKK
jgi:signal transduction histidine kinase/ligand-binding sensor domain-containing protein